MFSMVEAQYRPSPSRSWGERIINSASGLGSHFFQAPAELPLGKASSSQVYASSSTAARDIPHRRKGGGILACDFRRLREAEEEQQREAEFRRFAESGVGSWKDGEGEGMCGGYAEMQVRGEEFERVTGKEEEGEQHPFSGMATPMLSSGFMTPALRSGMVTPARSFTPHPRTTQQTDLWSRLDEVEDVWTRSQSAAVERLRQVQGHLDNRAPAKQHILRPIHPLPPTLEAFHQLLQSIRSDTSQAQEQANVTYFDCPHMECHRRLERQNASLPVEFAVRACVHTGCGFVAASVEEWVMHCTRGGHHVEGNEGAFGGCGRCGSLADTH